MERNGPIGVVVPNRDVAGGGLYNQQHGRKLCCFFHRRPVLSPSFSGCQNIQDNGDGDEANQHAVEPLNEDLEHGVAMVFSPGVNLVGIGFPIGTLVGF